MHRTIMKYLQEWSDHPQRKPLVLLGARHKFHGVDFGIDKKGDDLYFSVGDLVTDEDRLDDFLDFMSDIFWNMKTKKTYQTIWPNWWSSKLGEYKITLTKEDEDYDHT